MKKNVLFILIAMLMLIMAACGASETTSEEATDEGSTAEVEVTEEAEEITVTHELGETIVPTNPETVVVFDFGAIETLDTFGVEIAGVAKGTALPTYLSKYEGDDYVNVGSLKEPDFETIYGMNPDLILISARQAEAYEELSKIAPTVFVGVDTNNYMESFTENVLMLGEIFGKEDVAEAELAKINESVHALHEQLSATDENGLIVMSNSGSISAYGPASRFGLIHDVFGLKPADEGIEVSTHGMNVSFEYVAEVNPDYLFVIDRDLAVGTESVGNETFNNDIVNSTKAAQNDNIVNLSPTVWYLSGGGLISMNEMIREVKEGIQ